MIQHNHLLVRLKGKDSRRRLGAYQIMPPQRLRPEQARNRPSTTSCGGKVASGALPRLRPRVRPQRSAQRSSGIALRHDGFESTGFDAADFLAITLRYRNRALPLTDPVGLAARQQTIVQSRRGGRTEWPPQPLRPGRLCSQSLSGNRALPLADPAGETATQERRHQQRVGGLPS